MWISTRGQYGLRALVELAATPDKPTPVAQIAQAQGISDAYLEQILSELRRAGLVKSLRGAFGGYQLQKAAADITALEVIVLLEGDVAPVDCIHSQTGCQINTCGTHSLWERVDSVVRQVLGGSSVADLLEEARFQEAMQRFQQSQLHSQAHSQLRPEDVLPTLPD
jgi:Rrf2 family transcriptional regulator, cysteine metabolism repressor